MHRKALGGIGQPLRIAGLLLPVALALAGMWSYFNAAVTDPDTRIEISDFGRDLIGAEAASRGAIPYATLGELDVAGVIDPDEQGFWVAHPPVAIAMARFLLEISDFDAAQVAYQLFTVIGILALALALYWLLSDSDRTAAVLVSASIVLWIPAVADTVAVQGNAVVGFLILVVLLLDRKGYRAGALALLGFVVAWKIWPLPVAFLLPRSRWLGRDLAAVGGTSVLLTVVAAASVGGIPSLLHWIGTALPSNNEASRELSMALTAALPEVMAFAVYAGALALALAFRRHGDLRWRPLVAASIIGAASPIVWEHYWMALAPLIAWPLSFGSTPRGLRNSILAVFIVPATLTVATVFAGVLGVDTGIDQRRYMKLAAVGLLLISWRIASRSRPTADERAAGNS